MSVCKRIGCGKSFTEDSNHDKACNYHPGPPLFHDGMKEWSCCKQRHYDFGEFMAIPTCEVGHHSTVEPEKPKKEEPKSSSLPSRVESQSSSAAGANDCSWCRNGLECQVHKSGDSCARCKAGVCELHKQPAESLPTAVPPAEPAPKPSLVPVDPTVEQKCVHKACGEKFRECDNHDEACRYHPGPPVFHDRKKGWKCCDVHVTDFDEFLKIAPCTTGRHSAIE